MILGVGRITATVLATSALNPAIVQVRPSVCNRPRVGAEADLSWRQGPQSEHPKVRSGLKKHVSRIRDWYAHFIKASSKMHPGNYRDT